MKIIGPTEFGCGDRIGPGSVLEDVRQRLVALAAVLDAQAPNETQLRVAASELDALVHRLHWFADVTGGSHT